MYTLLDRNRHDNNIETRNTYNKQRETLVWFEIINWIRSPTSPAGELYKKGRGGGQEAFIVGTTEEESKKEELQATHTLSALDLEAISCQAVTDFV